MSINNKDFKKYKPLDEAVFIGTVTSKMVSAEFGVRLTSFSDKQPIDRESQSQITAKILGRLRSKIKIAVHDTVWVNISPESAKKRLGTIIRRDRRNIVPIKS